MHLNGLRGQFLLTFGVIYLIIGLNYALGAPDVIVKAMSWMPDWSSIQVCGVVWAASGLVASAFAFTPIPTDRFGFMALAGWSAAWSIAYLLSWVLGYDRGLVGALLFLVMTRALMLVAGMANPLPEVPTQASR